MSAFWSNWIIALTAINIIGVLWLLVWTRKQSPEDVAEDETCGHSYDGIEEYNMPLPKWWLNLFYIMIFFGFGYLLLFPGLGHYPGLIEWSSSQQWEDEVTLAENRYADIYAEYAKVSIEELQAYPEPLKVGQRLFANNCALCHGADAKGAKGFPNLTDADWLYGGAADAIKHSILKGRSGNMPAFGTAFQPNQVDALTHYVASLNGRSNINQALVSQGEPLFQSTCAGCHGVDGTGNQAMGAPNLADRTWLYGGSLGTIKETITNGRIGDMPSHQALLGNDKVHVIAAYVYSLSAPKPDADSKAANAQASTQTSPN